MFNLFSPAKTFSTPFTPTVPDSMKQVLSFEDRQPPKEREFSSSQPSIVDEKKKDKVIVINNNNNVKPPKSKIEKVPKKSAPKGAIPTEKQKYYQYLTYTQPKLFENDTTGKDNDIVQAIKDAFGQDNKEKLNMTNVETSQNYNQEEVLTKLRNELFDTETRLQSHEELRQEMDRKNARDILERFARKKEEEALGENIDKQTRDLEEEIANLEATIEDAKYNVNQKMGYKLRKELKKLQGEIASISYQERRKGVISQEKQDKRTKAHENAAILKTVIIPKKRGRPALLPKNDEI